MSKLERLYLWLLLGFLVSSMPVLAANDAAKFDQVTEIRRYCHVRQFAKALALANRYIKQHPKQHTGYHLRAIAYSNLNRHEAAMSDLDRAIELNECCKMPRINRANYNIARGRNQQAFDDLLATIQIDPGSIDEQIFRKVCRRLDRNPEAELKKARDKKNLLWQGLQADYKNDHATAIKFYTRYISLHPENYFGYSYRGHVHRYQKRYQQAIADFKKALQNHPEGGNRALAIAYVACGQPEKAIRIYRALLYTSTSRTNMFELVRLLLKLHRYKEAIGVCNKIMVLTANDADAHRIRGDCYAGLRQYEKAVEDYTKSLKYSFAPSASTYRHRAKAYKAIGKLDLYKNDMKRARKAAKSPTIEKL